MRLGGLPPRSDVRNGRFVMRYTRPRSHEVARMRFLASELGDAIPLD